MIRLLDAAAICLEISTWPIYEFITRASIHVSRLTGSKCTQDLLLKTLNYQRRCAIKYQFLTVVTSFQRRPIRRKATGQGFETNLRPNGSGRATSQEHFSRCPSQVRLRTNQDGTKRERKRISIKYMGQICKYSESSLDLCSLIVGFFSNGSMST